ncbi:hypothetical protein RB195_010406 [Necator americanus]|uniref:Reverse transcriptase domain-containing protein n=1 Tax=Necator americanus TaxID=51031 RepID=A0ABR1CY77_NECAM
MKGNARLPILVDQTGATYVTDTDKAKALSVHFANVFSSTCSDIIPEIVGIAPVQQQCSNMLFHPTDIYKHLKSLKPSVSETYDGIPPIVYEECAATLSPPLVHIFNISLSLGEVPEGWKNAIVTAIPNSPIQVYLNQRTTAAVRTPAGCTTPFEVVTGVRQGAVAGPFLFNFAIDDIMRRTVDQCPADIVLAPSPCPLADYQVCHNEGLYAEIDVVYRRMTRGRHRHLAPPSKAAEVNRLHFFGHILRRPVDRLVQRVLKSSSSLNWKKPPGRKRKFWTEVIKEDLRTLGVDRQFRRDIVVVSRLRITKVSEPSSFKVPRQIRSILQRAPGLSCSYPDM